jgi:heme/copper-type cytochrome/quinol oxidase subunit 2
MWNWILLAVIVGGVVALLAIAAVRQRRYSGDTPIGEQYKKNTKKGPSGGGGGGWG